MFFLMHPRGSWKTGQHSQSKVKEQPGQINNKKHPVQRSYHTWRGRSKMQLQQIQAETQLTKFYKLHKNKIHTKNKTKKQKAVQKCWQYGTIYLNLGITHLHNAIYCQTSHKIPVLWGLFIFTIPNWQTLSENKSEQNWTNLQWIQTHQRHTTICLSIKN